MSEDLKKRIIDPNLEADPSKYQVVFSGRYNTPDLLRKIFNKALEISGDDGFLSVLINKKTHEIMIGDTHQRMLDEAHVDRDDCSAIYAIYDKSTGKIRVADYNDFHPEGEKINQELKSMIASKLQSVIFG